MVVRVQAEDQSWVWLYMVLQLQPGDVPISSSNYIVRYVEHIYVELRLTDGEMLI